jgi:hypothetical protein
MPINTYEVDKEQVRRTIDLFFEPGQVFECRCLETTKYSSSYAKIRSGYFTKVNALLRELDGIEAKGIYVTLNPVKSTLLARANNRLRHSKDQPTTSDVDITARHWILIDCDPVRVSEISSSDEEHEAGLALARSIRNALSDLGWPDPIYADSGNGGHLLYRIDLPADDGGLVQRMLQAIAQGFDTEAVKVDQNVFNAARISKLYGTWARKGDDSPELGRPHRLSQILEAPDVVEVVCAELLEALAETASAEPSQSAPKSQSTGKTPFDMETFLDKYGIERTGPRADKDGTQRWDLKECPLCRANGAGNTSVSVFLTPDGKPGFKCMHSQCGDMHWLDFRKCYEPDYKEKKRRRASPHFGNGLKACDIIVNEQKDVNLHQAIDSLHWLNKQNPRIFAHGAAVVQVGLERDIKNPRILRPSLIPLDQHSLSNLMSEAANYYRDTQNGPVDIYPPAALASGILALTPHQRDFPSIKAVIEAPTFREDGSLITMPGYDEASGYFYYPSRAMSNVVIPEKPSKDDVIAARNVLWDVFGEFPYVSDADRANNFAFGLTPFIRPFIDGLAPMCYMEASIAGSGKGLNTDTWALIASGQVAAKCSAVDNTELEKRIFSMLSAGRTLICIDNVRGKLDSKALEAALTAELWQGRKLGKSEDRQIPNLATWCCNGNNATLGGDLPRRCYRVRFTPDTARPWRKKFRIEDLPAYVRKHRGELVQACLTIIAGWLAAGRPAGSSSVLPLGSYGAWTHTMNGILTYAEIGGFLDNLEEFYAENNDEVAQITPFIEACATEYAGREVTVNDIVVDLRVPGSMLADALPPDLSVLVADKATSDKAIVKDLGYKLRRYKDRPFGDQGWRVVRAGQKGHTKSTTWKFVKAVSRNLTPWITKNAGDAGDAGDVLNARNSETHFPNGDVPSGDNKKDILNFNDEKHDPHAPHHPQSSNGHISDEGWIEKMLNDDDDFLADIPITLK